MTTNRALVELRDLLYEAPSRALWGRLCALIEDAAPGEPRAMALAYAREHLRRWPDHLRFAVIEDHPARWYDHQAKPWTPLVRSLRLSMISWEEDIMEDFVFASASASLRQLSLHYNNFSEDALKIFCAAPCIERLRCLSWFHAYPGEAATFLTRLPPWTRLSHLCLTGVSGLRLPDPLAARATLTGGLRTLGLRDSHLQAADLHHISAALPCEALAALDLSNNRLNRAAISPLLALAGPRLRWLSLRHNRLLNEGAVALGAAHPLMQLAMLDISYNGISRAESVSALSRAPWWGGLRCLSLSGNPLEPGALRALSRRAPPRLSLLHLDEVGAREEELEELVEQRLPALRRLRLEDNGLPLGALERLIRAPWWGGLRRLGLQGNQLGPGAGRLLARYGEGLRELRIDGARLGPEGLRALLSRPGGLPLRSLSLARDVLDAQTLRELLCSPGLPRLERLEVNYGSAPADMEALCAQAAARGVTLILA